MTNQEMKAGRFLKLARGRRIMRAADAVWNAGGVVVIATCTRRTEIKAKSRECIRMGASGSVYMRRGKHWDCVDGCAFGFWK